jgi:hypothetical protein
MAATYAKEKRNRKSCRTLRRRSDHAKLISRRTVINEMRSIENVARAILREADIEPGTPPRAVFADRVRE